MTNEEIKDKPGYYWFKPDKFTKELEFLDYEEAEPWTLVVHNTYNPTGKELWI